jgi:hypothetical protein
MNLYDTGPGGAHRHAERAKTNQRTVTARYFNREVNAIFSKAIEREQRAARMRDLDKRLREIGRRP